MPLLFVVQVCNANNGYYIEPLFAPQIFYDVIAQ